MSKRKSWRSIIDKSQRLGGGYSAVAVKHFTKASGSGTVSYYDSHRRRQAKRHTRATLQARWKTIRQKPQTRPNADATGEEVPDCETVKNNYSQKQRGRENTNARASIIIDKVLRSHTAVTIKAKHREIQITPEPVAGRQESRKKRAGRSSRRG